MNHYRIVSLGIGIIIVSLFIVDTTCNFISMDPSISVDTSKLLDEKTDDSFKSPPFDYLQHNSRLRVLSQYSTHEPISINGNADFINQTTSQGWNGTGTSTDPVLIVDYNITHRWKILLEIRNTDLYFRISNNFFHGTISEGVYLNNVTHGIISNNNIQDCEEGVSLNSSKNVIISGNNLEKNQYSLHVDGSTQNIIKDNMIEANVGITLFYSMNNTLVNNTIYATSSGIEIDMSAYNLISANIIRNASTMAGIFLKSYSYYNKISNNILLENYHAIRVSGGRDGAKLNFDLVTDDDLLLTSFLDYGSYLKNNNSYNSRNHYEAFFAPGSNNNVITNNSIIGNSVGLFIAPYYNEENTVVQWNDFIANEGGAHAADSGTNTTFTYNYWDGWTTPDADGDGIVDQPYLIPAANYTYNIDPYPLTTPVNPSKSHYLKKPTILYPNGGELLKGIVLVHWTAATDSLGYNVYYTLYYSMNLESNWSTLATNLVLSNYQWNTFSMSNGENYFLKIVAYSSGGLIAEDISNANFTIQNDLLDVILYGIFLFSAGFVGSIVIGTPIAIVLLHIFYPRYRKWRQKISNSTEKV